MYYDSRRSFSKFNDKGKKMKAEHQVELNESFLFPGCDGCCKIKNACSFSIYYKIEYINKCPCKDCIVKTTCSETYCDERSTLYANSVVADKRYRLLGKEFPNE